jgi:hypothetical protein
MESIRARMASRINGTYNNENMTDVFKTLGLHNNDSSSLQASNAAPTTTGGAATGDGAAFIARAKSSRLPGSEATYPIKDSFSWIEPYRQREHAYTWPQYQVSNESAYLNDVPAGQHQYPYDTMESIRARIASRDNGTVTNEGMTDTFRALGLHNNDSSSLSSANAANATGASFIATKLRDPAAGGDAPEKLHFYRHEAWNEANLNATHQREYPGDNPAGYVVEPLPLTQSTPGGADGAAFLAKKDDAATLHFYRHEAWNEANHNATHVAGYTGDSPQAYLVPPMQIETTTPGGAQDGSFIISKKAQGEPVGFIMRKVKKTLPGSEATYPIKDSFSWIEPYRQREHAYTWPQYQVSNESAYLNDVPAGQHQYPYDTMESIRARIASRDNGTYNNGEMKDTFKTLGLWNNDTSSLQASNNANASGSTTGGATATAFVQQPERLLTIAEALRARRNY